MAQLAGSPRCSGNTAAASLARTAPTSSPPSPAGIRTAGELGGTKPPDRPEQAGPAETQPPAEQREARLRALDRHADRTGYTALIAATFFEAADQRFAASHAKADIVEFVASARASSPSVAGKVDPLLTERMIRGVFEDESLGDVSGQIVVEKQLLLAAALRAALALDAARAQEWRAHLIRSGTWTGSVSSSTWLSRLPSLIPRWAR